MSKRIKIVKNPVKLNPYDIGYKDGYDVGCAASDLQHRETIADKEVIIIELQQKLNNVNKIIQNHNNRYHRLHTQYLHLTTAEQRDKLAVDKAFSNKLRKTKPLKELHT